MLVSEGGVSDSGESTLDGATHDDGRDRGELVPGELAPVAGWMGNCRDRRFPWPTTSTWDVVLERECGIGAVRREKSVVEELEEEAVERGVLEEAVEPCMLDLIPMQRVWGC